MRPRRLRGLTRRPGRPRCVRRDDVVVSVTAGGDPARAKRLRDAMATALDTGSLPLRRHRAGLGHVALVGGGPGDPGLITTRGRALLAQADVVVVDRLAPRALLAELDDDVEVIEAGKAPHAHTLTQAQIEDLLVDRARAGLRVVRLKAATPTCSDVVARRPWRASPPASPSRSSPA